MIRRPAARTLAALTLLLAVGAPTLASADEAIFAGGCFWSMETDLDRVPGVTATQSGYTGGHLANPTYEDVITETTGHYEAVRVTYDPARISYEKLVDAFFHSIDPTDSGGQFCDRGESYRTAVFAIGPEQTRVAEAAKAAVAKELDRPIATEVKPAAVFTPAEEYHQDYAIKNPGHYKRYRTGCGRDAQVRAVWGETAQRGMAPELG